MASRAPQDEISQLRARIDDLEAELSRREARERVGEFEPQSPRASTRSRRSRSQYGSDREGNAGWRSGSSSRDFEDTLTTTGNVASDVYQTAVEQSGRKLRGVTQASLDQLYSIKDVAAYFITTLPADLLDSMVNAVDRYVDLSSNAVDNFYQGYRREPSTRYQRRNQETERASAGRSASWGGTDSAPLLEDLRVVSTSPDMGSSGPVPNTITVTFNRDIVPVGGRGFNNSLVVQLGSTAITGRTILSGRDTLMWSPGAPLAPGTYTVTVSNVESLLGPLREPFVFTFTVTAPASGKS